MRATFLLSFLMHENEAKISPTSQRLSAVALSHILFICHLCKVDLHSSSLIRLSLPACLPADALTLKEVNSKATRTNVAPTQILIFSLSLLALEIFPFPFFISLKRVGSRESLCQRFLSSCLTFRLFMHAPHMSLGRAREIQLGCSAPLLAEILFSSRASSNV